MIEAFLKGAGRLIDEGFLLSLILMLLFHKSGIIKVESAQPAGQPAEGSPAGAEHYRSARVSADPPLALRCSNANAIICDFGSS